MATGKCDGGVFISNGKVLGSGGFGGMFGVTKDGHWVIGTLDNSTVTKLGVTYAVNAFGWLVRNGTSVITQKVERLRRGPLSEPRKTGSAHPGGHG